MIKEVKRLGSEPVDAASLQLFKNMSNGGFAMGLENKGNVANYAYYIETEKLPKDFYQTYLKKLNAVTPADVERVAKQYFPGTQSRIIIVGKASEIAPKLEKLGYTVKYYDAYANAL